MLEDKIDKMIELLEEILNRLNCPCRPWWVWEPYEQPYYMNTTGTHTTTGTAVDAEAR